ncbi:17069_t:CDS:2 [Acaulospora morrowiae]|uniref:17069_t:CDS:1 n=1 Tax=Acaulospora morrowiae TaxID=94023 RepID=A0A9N8VZ74_9GLOM|nr:17069_t:CDS:2 [Acaulospora morrowiae]
MLKYQLYDKALFFIFMIICTFGIIEVVTQRDVTIQLPDSQIVNGTLGPESSSNVHFMYNSSFVSLTLDKSGGLAKVFGRAVTTSRPSAKSSTTGPKTSTSALPASKAPLSHSNSTTVHFTVTTCGIPVDPNTPANVFAKSLKVYVSEDPLNPQPGPSNYTAQYDVTNGYVKFTSTSRIIYIGVFTPVQTGLVGNYTFQIGASTQRAMHYIPSLVPNIALEDTDNSTALFRIDQDIDSSLISTYIAESNYVQDLQNSLCAFQYFQSNKLSHAVISYNLTTRGFIYPNYGSRITISIRQLTNGTKYTALVVYNQPNVENVPSKSSPIFLKTKSQTNCRLITGLSFCDRVAYSVPANPALPVSTIVDFFNNLALSYYQNFSISVAQLSNTSHYSLVRDINDCLASYKNWICAVTIPRCGDVDGTGITREVNQSRVSDIDSQMVPGAYIEVPPCIDLCYNTTQSCPVTLSFACPPNKTLLLSSYGMMGPNNNASNGTNGMFCNPMGSDWVKSNIAVRKDILPGHWKWVIILINIILGVWVSSAELRM